MSPSRRALFAYTAPFLLFMAGLAAVQAATGLGITSIAGIRLSPMYWIYPVQTGLCAAALYWFRKGYDFGGTTGTKILWGVAAGLLIFMLWVSPQEFLHRSPRLDGFDPGVLPGWTFWMTAARFVRLVIVVPLVEEIFWRGFLLRYLVKEDFTSLPFGSCNRTSFVITSAAFALVHQWADFLPALLAGILLNMVAVRTRSLWACVVGHAAANLSLGIYICTTRQWGFW